MSIKPNDFTLSVGQLLDDYAEDVQEAVAQSVEKAGKEALKIVKAKSPGRGRYKKGWKMKTERGGVYKTQVSATIYNSTDGPLVHLVEKGHDKSNHRGQVEGIPHMRPAYEEAERLLPDLTARAIKEAGER